MEIDGLAVNDGTTVPPATLAQSIRDLARAVDIELASGSFRDALDTMARFWRYSWCNAHTILSQRPSATWVTGRRTWSALGRTVRDGERPISILAPMSPRGFPFRLVEVFDVAQTDGRALARLEQLQPGRTAAAAMLERAATHLGIAVTHCGTASLGRSLGGTIEVRRSLGERDRAAVLAHELAHELLHQHRGRRRPLAERETEAEATSYVVLRALGVPSTAPTYIAWQRGDGATVLASLRRIQRAAKRILDAAHRKGP